MVLPEVSLLVLDEPSLHLDHEAVESLRDLLQNLGSTLASSEAQVIVCDHNPILLPAMGKVVTLTANN
jgi:ATPase subunit of ABC transporter with duplicated ATPase domains